MDFRRKRWLCLGRFRDRLENNTADVATRVARSAPQFLHARTGKKVERDFSHTADGRDVGQVDSSAINFEHIVCPCAYRMGNEVDRDGDSRSAADDCNENSLYARRGASIRWKFSLLSCSE